MMDYLEPYGVKVGRGKYHEEIVYRLVILSNRIIDEISIYLQTYKLTPAKMNTLMIVKHQGGESGMSQIDLSQRLMVSTSNLTRVLAKLQRDRLIRRGSIATDKRFKTIHITVKGSKLLDEVWPGYTKKLVSLTEGLDKEKKRILSEMLSDWMQFVDSGKKNSENVNLKIGD
ncbi:MAG: MarR family transcriptional regulator [Candidatus Omnitrophica bacterium]|nr:MarR family transcriptional regulator [Candidatus Omnitrophota bacterium]